MDMRPTLSLVPYEFNNKIHGEDEVNRLANSISEFGWTFPILIDEQNIILAGHKRLLAALKLGLTEVPVIVKTGLSKAQKKAYRIIDNKSTQESEWNLDSLQIELEALDELDFNLESFANIDFEFPEHADDKEIACENPYLAAETTRIKPTDVLTFNDRHVVHCSNARDASFPEAALLFTSPPYGLARDYEGCDLSVIELAQNIFRHRSDLYVVNLGILRQKSEIVRYWDEYIETASEVGLKLLSWNVWDKGLAGSVSNQGAMFAIEHEWLLCFGREEKPIRRFVEKSAESDKRNKYYKRDARGRQVRAVRQQDGSMENSSRGSNFEHKNLPSIVQCFPEMNRHIPGDHPAPMPTTLPSWFIEAATDENDVILDPFLGSGTTLIAADQLNRLCHGSEIAPIYCQTIVDRFRSYCQKENKPCEIKLNGEVFNG